MAIPMTREAPEDQKANGNDIVTSSFQLVTLALPETQPVASLGHT